MTLRETNQRLSFAIFIVAALWTSNRGAAAAAAEPPHVAAQKTAVHFIDVGYGDAILLSLPTGINVLVDAGGEETGVHIVQYLGSQNIQAIDLAVITHPHENHFGGFWAILEHMPVHTVVFNGDLDGDEGYAELLRQIDERKIKRVELTNTFRKFAGAENWSLELYQFGGPADSVNDRSIVAYVRHEAVGFLLLSDIGPAKQDFYLSRYPHIFNASCVQIPHHGGPISETLAVSFPNRTFIISTGPNEWGKPDMAHYHKLTGDILRTDQEGPIVMYSDGKTITRQAE